MKTLSVFSKDCYSISVNNCNFIFQGFYNFLDIIIIKKKIHWF